MTRLHTIATAAVLSFLSLGSSAFAAGSTDTAQPEFGKVKMISQPDAKHTESTKGVLTFDDANRQAVFNGKDGARLFMPYSEIRSIRLEHNVTRLQVPFVGKVQHSQYLTVQYRGANTAPAYAVFDLNGRSYREIVAALESKSGKQAEWKSEQ